MRRLRGLYSVVSLSCAALAVAACTPGTASPAGHVSASGATTPAASVVSPGQASGPGKGNGTQGPGSAATPPRWGSAFQVPGLNGLNAGLQAQVLSVSCPSAGNCAAGGFYADAAVAQQAFVVTETAGRWASAVEVPGTRPRNTGRKAQVSALSCPSAGNCAAAGYYTDSSSGLAVPFTAQERNGTWQSAMPVPGIAALTRGADAQVTVISCPSAGNCAAGGFYASVTGGTPSFVVTEHNGTWGNAQAVSGTGAFAGTGQQLGLAAISCAAPGSCAAGGTYTADAAGTSRGFVVTEVAGHWGRASPAPGGHAASAVTAISCPAPGYCVAGGTVTAGPVGDGFVIAQTRGAWGRPLIMTSTGSIAAVSCAAPGNCSAGGASGDGTGFVVTESSGSWHKPHLIRLTNAQVSDISCGTVSGSMTCTAVGAYLRGASADKAGFAISAAGGTWGSPVPVAGPARLATSGAPLTAISCAAGRCSAGGYYLEAGMGTQGFLVSNGA